MKSVLKPPFDHAQQATEDNYGSVVDAKERDLTDAVKNDITWWHRTEIDGNRWNKAYPYQLLIVKRDKDRWFSNDTVPGVKLPKFTLPIPPESLSITMPFAIRGGVTLGGFIEEHNGAPIRMISLSGTTGVQPMKLAPGPLDLQNKTANKIGSIFAGTLTAVNRTASSFQTLVKGDSGDFTTNMLADNPKGIFPEQYFGSGYMQFRILQRFFEDYVALKKTAAGSNYALAFAIWKDEAVYLVTPQSFDYRRSAGSPWEYTYSISLKAWRRIDLGLGPEQTNLYTPTGKDPNKLRMLLARVTDARAVLHNLSSIFQGATTDISQNVFKPMREVALFAKDTLGVGLAIHDMGNSIVKSSQTAVTEWKTIQDVAKKLAGNPSPAELKARDDIQAMMAYSIASGTAESRNGIPGGLPGATRPPGTPAPNLEADPVQKMFNNPDEHYDLFSNISIGQLNLPASVNVAIEAEKGRVRSLKRADFEQRRDALIEVLADVTDKFGAGDSTYDAVYGRTSTATVSRTPTTEEMDVLWALNEGIMALDELAASSETDRIVIDPLEVTAGLALRSGVAFRIPTSKFLVPFPYENTLEQLAARYLLDPDRWLEIAALNGLQSPYVDEEGFERPLLTNGFENKVVIEDPSNLYVGQIVTIVSTTAKKTKRRITKIDIIDASQTIITLDGDPDMDVFLVVAAAKLHAFLPNTVNSQMNIFIPSEEEPAEEDFLIKKIPGVDYFDEFVQLGGVGILLTNDGDLVIGQDGNTRLAIGLTNLVQRVRLILSTPQGSLLRHPEFGFPIQPGMSTGDASAKEIFNACKTLLANETAFSGISYCLVDKKGPVTSITLAAELARSTNKLPITVNIKSSNL